MLKDQEPTVLIVEDDPSLGEVLAKQFERLGCRTLRAINGSAALEIIEKHAVTAVLCDIQMPKMNGIAFLAELEKTGREVPVMMMTGFAHYTDDDILGARVLLKKPFTLAQLRETVDHFVKYL